MIIEANQRKDSGQKVFTLLFPIMIYFQKHFRGLYNHKYYSITTALLEMVIFLPGRRPITVSVFTIYTLYNAHLPANLF